MWGLLSLLIAAEVPTSTTSNVETLVIQGGRGRRSLPTPEAASRIYLERFDLEAADLGELLARQQGIMVQRSGGLGSDARLSLNGLSGDQVRFFLDGLPLDLAGLPIGITNVPPGILDEIIVHRGVVPTRLGADALGGAIEVTTKDEIYGVQIQASYVGGSFNTHRLSAVGSAALDDDGLFARVYGFLDSTENNYSIAAPIINEQGRAEIESVDRFNDAYQTYGASAELGWSRHPDFGSLSLRTYFSSTDKEIQNDPSGNIAYGEVERGIDVLGGVVRYDVPLTDDVRLSGTGGAAYASRFFTDVSSCIYNWLGECPRTRTQPGEINNQANDLTQNNLSIFLRTSLALQLEQDHKLTLSVAPSLTFSNGEQRVELPGGVLDPAEADRRLVTAVGGLDYEIRTFSERLTTVFFAKVYLQAGNTEVIQGAEIEGTDNFGSTNLGGGAVARLTVLGPLDLEGSYEYATRLPNETELFGVPGQIFSNTELEPERSHNVNLGIKLTPWASESGQFRGTLNGFLRDTTNLIRLVGNELFLVYANVVSARSLGVEGALSWTSPGRYISLDASATYMDFRNTSSEGPSAALNGDRIPNIPYLFGSATARFRFPSLFMKEDAVEFAWTTRYVNEFFLTWESLGDLSTKPTIESQLSSSANLGYRFLLFNQPTTTSFDVQNIFDDRLFDFFGVQKPGRAFYFRVGVVVSPD